MSNIFPCVIFAFNRPGKLQQVLDALKSQRVERLIVFVDGPRDEHDLAEVERCRTIAKGIDWIDKELFLKDQNHGLEGIIENIDRVFSRYRWAAFVEDDCLPMPGFYAFMRETLKYYLTDKRVFSIGGYQYLPWKYFRNYPYSLVSIHGFVCWGWATWQDRWQHARPYIERYAELFDNLTNVPDPMGNNLPAMARTCAQSNEKSWDIKVTLAALWLNQVQLLPTRGLVRNIGLESGVHGNSVFSPYHNRNVFEQNLDTLMWLEDIRPPARYMIEYQNYIQRIVEPPIYYQLVRRTIETRLRLQRRLLRKFRRCMSRSQRQSV